MRFPGFGCFFRTAAVFLLLSGAGQAVYAADPVISEFLAKNVTGVQDASGAYPDWIEIYNPGTTAVDLSGWYLTDDSADLTQWAFPANTSIPANGYQVVFADGGTSTTSELHASFSLKAGGEYLALVKPDGTTVVHEYAPAFPAQTDDVSYGISGNDKTRGYFFNTPTPGTVNQIDNAGEVNFLSGTTPKESGVFTSNFTLTLTAATGTTIRYILISTNTESQGELTGTIPEPTAASALYSGPITISNTVMVRARAFKTGVAEGPIASRTFIKLDSSSQIFSSNLPIIIINTFGYDVNKDNDPETEFEYCPAFSAFINTDETSGTATLTSTPDLTTRMGIKVRGNSSADDNFLPTKWPKKQYRIELWEEDQSDRKEKLFGMSAEADWVLQAPYSDKTLMRNYLIYKWSDDMGQDFAVKTRFVEVFLDRDGGTVSYPGDYVGVYVLMEKIEQGEGRVDIKGLDPEDNAEPDVTGGYILAVDRSEKVATEGFIFNVPDPDAPTTNEAMSILYVSPKPEAITSAQETYIKGYLQEFTDALTNDNATTDYTSYISVKSFIDQQILVELSMNLDGLKYSTYMYKDRDGQLHAGPAWDFNLGLGNTDMDDTVTTDSWSYSTSDWQSRHDYSWWGWMFNDPDYRQRWYDRWAELRQTIFTEENLMADIDTTATKLSAAAERNFNDKWKDVLGQYIWGNIDDADIWKNNNDATSFGSVASRTSYQSEVDLMKDWITARLAGLDKKTGWSKVPTFSPLPTNKPVTSGMIVTLTQADGTIYYTTDGTDPRGSGDIPGSTAQIYVNSTSTPISITGFTQITARMRYYYLDYYTINKTLKRQGLSGTELSNLLTTLNNSSAAYTYYPTKDALGTAVTSKIGTAQYNEAFAKYAENWTPPVTASYSSNGESYYSGLVISEIMYNPPDMDGANKDDFEFIEIKNTGTSSISLAGVSVFGKYETSPMYIFGNETLGAGNMVVIVSNATEFAKRYPNVTIPDGRTYSGNLSNGGEIISLKDGLGNVIFTVTYDDTAGWPVGADGGGASLILTNTSDPGTASSWQPSTYYYGTPGTDGGTGGTLTLADAIKILKILSGIEVATDVTNPLIADVNGDGVTGLEEVIYILQTVSSSI